MTVKILHNELRVANPDEEDGLYGHFEVEIYGLLSRLKGHHYGYAHFGCFENTGNRTLLYSATVYRENGSICHPYESEFEDDFIALKNGNPLTLLD
jgi:hypothetical protein